MILHVRNFGKIESADIDLSDLTIFVGENNSGKTYLMQLIYGVLKCLLNIRNLKNIELDDLVKLETGSFVNAGNQEVRRALECSLNDYLASIKDNLIRDIFHSNDLKVKSISLTLCDIKHDYSLKIRNEFDSEDMTLENEYLTKYELICNDHTFYTATIPNRLISIMDKNSLLIGLLLCIFKEENGVGISNSRIKNIVYLPASRSGIMLLYANYLSNENVSPFYEPKPESQKNSDENEYGLTTPIYDFLMFLLKHKERELINEEKQKLLLFINENIINGSLAKVGNTMRYTPSASDSSLPIYLSSSLVSELAPICQIISGINNIEYVLYDEIETCQHPTKQRELARLLVRMVNAGYKMIVSTHSDTMAAAINNLITLSYKKDSKNLAEELGYTEDDLLVDSSVRAYQFIIDESTGKTKVEEIPSHFSIGIGFDFTIFNKTNDKIYQDAVRLAEVD